jgi:four helix bundle protein
MDENEFKQRTKNVALRVIRLTESLQESPSGRILGKQLLRCGTSIGANYRAVCRA